MDNLNLHGRARPTPFGPGEGAALWARFTPHYTPKHGSWLNPAEIEASLWARECRGRDRVDTFDALRDRTRAWNTRADRAKRTITWRFTTAKARRVFRYKAEHYVAVEALVPKARRRCRHSRRNTGASKQCATLGPLRPGQLRPGQLHGPMSTDPLRR